MIKIVDGSLLDATEDILCHQVNCQGNMGAGVAKLLLISILNLDLFIKTIVKEQCYIMILPLYWEIYIYLAVKMVI